MTGEKTPGRRGDSGRGIEKELEVGGGDTSPPAVGGGMAEGGPECYPPTPGGGGSWFLSPNIRMQG